MMHLDRKYLRLGIVLMVGSLLSAVAGCGNDTTDNTAGQPEGPGTSPSSTTDEASWDSVVAEAIEEGEVTVYSNRQDAAAARLIAAFEEEYPEIRMNYVFDTPQVLIPRIAAEQENSAPGADVVIMADLGWVKAESESNNVVPHSDLPSMEGWYEAAPSEADHPDWYTASLIPLVIAWNTNLVQEPLASYEDLLDPALQGKLGSLDVGGAFNVLFYNHLVNIFGPNGVEEFAAQGPFQIYAGSAPIAQSLASGEIAATPYGSLSGLENALDAGAPIDYVIPPNGVAAPYGLVVLRNAAHPAAAKVAADFIASPAGQSALNERQGVSLLGAELAPGTFDATVKALDTSTVSEEQLEEWRVEYTRMLQG